MGGIAGEDVGNIVGMVVGAGNSACDIAADICPVTTCRVMAARSPVLVMPRMFLASRPPACWRASSIPGCPSRCGGASAS